jgi:hypothetical protein
MTISLRAFALVALASLTGCTSFYARSPSYYEGSYDSYERTDIDELLKFGGDFANQSASFRVEECHRLLKREKKNPVAGIALHLLMGRMLSDACGDIPKVLKSVAAIPPSSLRNDRVERLVAFNVEALKRMAYTQPRSVAAGTGKKTKGGGGGGGEGDSRSDDAKLLREKLDAIRSIEKNMDENDRSQ